MKKIVVAIISIVLIVSLAAYYFVQSNPKSSVKVTVSKIIDGDTIMLSNGDIVRLIGIDAPERNQPLFAEVKNELEKLVGKQVRLEKDVSHKDSYGRLLRYAFLDEYFVNLELIRNGLAVAYVVEPDTKYAEEFLQAEIYAKKNKLGIWEESDFANCISLENFHYNAKGNDLENMNDEYVVFKNTCDFEIDLAVWTVKDLHGNVYEFPEYSVKPGTMFTIFSGEGENSEGSFYWSAKYPVWNNDGDALTLRDSSGRLVIFESYKAYK